MKLRCKAQRPPSTLPVSDTACRSWPLLTGAHHFTGTSIHIYGGSGPSFSNYTVVLDPSLPQPYTYDGSAYAAQNGTEPFLLCAINGLSWAEHTVEITNTGSGMLLDQVIYETQFGASG